jgi:hypothetical protein
MACLFSDIQPRPASADGVQRQVCSNEPDADTRNCKWERSAVNGSTTSSAPKIDPDKAAAHEFLSELNTRIATQPLPYQYGVEARALESLWELFGHAREAMKKYPDCKVFAEAVTKMLNEDLRPVTAKWHRAHEEGILDSRDGADEFRGDLAKVQEKLREFAGRLQILTYGSKLPDISIPPVLPATELDECLKDLVFGLGKHPQIRAEKIDAINLAEALEVKERRRLRGHTAPDRANAVGLGLSGGGIRSATFCLGVTQVLAARGLLRDVDFLSTVSGGGYTGSFLTARLGQNEPYDDVAGPHGPDPSPIRYLRYHAKYLTAVDLKDRWSMVTATLAGMILNWSAPVLLVVLAALSAKQLADVSPGAKWWPIMLAVLCLLTVMGLVLYGLLMRKGPKTARFGGDLLGWLVAATALLGAGWLVAIGYQVIPSWIASHSIPDWIKSHWLVSGGLGGLTVVGPAVLRFIPVLKTPRVRIITLKALLWIAGLIVPLGALGLFYALWWLADRHGAPMLIVIAIASAIVAIAVLNVNLTAPHRLYRDRLAATFIQKEKNGGLTIPLTNINPGNTAPYHLINAALNLPSSTNPALRDRKCDFFLFSKHWCGSPMVGYHKTADWKTNGSPSDLATAIAISGAAVSSHMGLGSMPSLTALLTFLNVRLGFWIRNPERKEGFQTPGFLCLVREMIGIQMSEDRAWLNLSDGGHIENMAVYELLRRRCKYMICVDGESDPNFTFQGLMTLARHAQIDFGIHIESSLNELKPDPKTNFSHVHAVLCRVHYPDEGAGRPKATGLLLYLKLSVTGNEPELIKRYRINHPEFPHETTLEQFFDEEQFEAYHQLGVHVADGLFSRGLMSGNTEPPTVAQWFRQLAANLLNPQKTA